MGRRARRSTLTFVGAIASLTAWACTSVLGLDDVQFATADAGATDAAATDGAIDAAADAGMDGACPGCVVIARNLGRPRTLAVGGSTLFIGTETDIQTCSLPDCAGGPKRLSAADQPGPMTVVGNRLYFADITGNLAVIESDPDSGAAVDASVLIAAAARSQSPTAFFPPYLLYSAANDIAYCPLGSTPCASVLIALSSRGAIAIASGGTDIWFITGLHEILSCVPAPSCMVGSRLLLVDPNASNLALSDTEVFWTDESTGDIRTAHRADAVAADGGPPAATRTLVTAASKPHALAWSGTSLYFATPTQVLRVGDTGPPVVALDGLGAPSDIKFAGNYAFVADRLGGSILRAPRD